jgi:ribosome maturation factor RimP
VGKTRSLILKRTVEALKITEKVASLVAPKIGELGFELYDVEFNKEYGSWELLIFIDSPSGVTLDDCERVSTAIDPIIEEADPIEQAYFLTVSSVGIDKPLKLSKDFDRSIGSKIDVKLYTAPSDKALGKNKNFTAVLVAHDEETFTVENEKGSFTLPKKAAALLRPHIDF